VLAGKAAGMDTVAVTWGAGVANALHGVRPSAVATTADELRTAMLG
jgi:pyrophosphatase PpaX